ncbi:ANTAR domain-containing protein [Streptomyces sp. NPDC051320]|uniref:ANTAR domain-containing protein n=1 Tax=Streptomyces sp. NPDC051320 TaxID=3154644 RepID=UPI0034230B8D
MRMQEVETIGTQGGTDAASQELSDEWQASDAAQYRAVGSLLEGQTASRQTEDLRHEVDGLRQALRTHPLIDTARGIVMATGSCSEEEAWQVLVDVSQCTNIKLREIAQRLVDSITGPPPSRPIKLAFQAALDRMRAGRT